MPIFKLDEFLLNILPKKRLIGIDPGTKTLGIAVSNTDLTVASPIKTIKRKKLASDINELLSIFNYYDVAGLRCDSVRDFTKSILRVKDLPIFFQDERMSTMAIERPMIMEDMTRKKRSVRTDQLAACWILQTALDGLQKKM